MKAAARWVATNCLIVASQVVAAATMWAGGTLLLAAGPTAAGQWWMWMLVGMAGIGSAIAFLFWVVGFARAPKKKGVRHVAGR